MQAVWGETHDPLPFAGAIPHEATLLRLDCSKARAALGWRPALTLETALDWIVRWHKAVGLGGDARDVTLQQIADYGGRSSTAPKIGPPSVRPAAA